MQYTAKPFYNENEGRVVYLIDVTFDDETIAHAEMYADDVTSEEDLKNRALSLVAQHDAELAEAAAKEQAKADALAKIPVPEIEAVELKAEEVQTYKEAVAAELKQAEAEVKAEEIENVEELKP